VTFNSKLGAPDPSVTASPIPQVSIPTTPAPTSSGQKKGNLTNSADYSRVNTGVPTNPDAGAAAQKSVPPVGAAMLGKTASLKGESSMTTSASRRPLIQDLVKAAMDSSSERAKIADEFTRQGAGAGTDAAPEEKTASAKPVDLHDFALKLANAVEEATPQLVEQLKEKEAKVSPGTGPGANTVLESNVGGKQLFAPGQQGHGTNITPTSTGLQKARPTDATTQVPNTIATPAGGPGHQKVSSAPIDLIRAKIASAKTEKKETEGMQQAEAGLAKAEAAHSTENKKEAGECKCGKTPCECKPKEASASSLVDYLTGKIAEKAKLAEDAINPAKISAGPAAAPSGLESGEQGGVRTPPRAEMVSSTESVTNMTRGKTKAHEKSELKNYFNQPALSSKDDNVLQKAFNNTGKAGVKIAESAVGNAAARLLLDKLASEVVEDKKGAEQSSVAN
jgi:hypothetical protein